MITNQLGINLRYKKEALEFLEENLRFDMDRFYQLNRKIFEDYENIGKKATSIHTILKLLQHIKQVKADVMPFIKNPKDMTIWSNEYFLQLAKMINIESLRYLPPLSHGGSISFENRH